MKYILKPIITELKTNVFEVDIKYMHGHASCFTHDVFTVKTEARLEKIVNYANLPEAKLPFDNEKYIEWAKKAFDFDPNILFDVPLDHTRGYAQMARFIDITVHYYNETGEKFLVEFENKGEEQ